MINTNTGAYVSLAGIVIAIAQLFNKTLDEQSVLTVISALGIIWGFIHQWVTARKVRNLALGAGVKGIK